MTSGRAVLIAIFAVACVVAGVIFMAREPSPDVPVVNTVSDSDAPKKGVAAKTIDAVKSAASQAGDILSRIPCLPAKGIASAASLPRVAKRIAAGEPVTIIAFGSSTTVGFGTSSPSYTYPNRLADQLRRKFPDSTITVINRGIGGQDTPEMMKRFDTDVLDANPDLVIWQLGTNTVIKGTESDVTATRALVEDGLSRLQARDIDVVLIDPQYAPAVTAKQENASRMVKLIGDIAKLRHVGLFPRFEVMKQWHEIDKMPLDSFVNADGLHMNDWGYACFAQLLGDTIIKGVGQVKAGAGVAPAEVNTYRPL
jgi:lysophospholipase L1-like esterase